MLMVREGEGVIPNLQWIFISIVTHHYLMSKDTFLAKLLNTQLVSDHELLLNFDSMHVTPRPACFCGAKAHRARK